MLTGLFYHPNQSIQHYQMSPRFGLKHIIAFLALALSIAATLNQSQPFRIIKLNRTGHLTASTIFKRAHPPRVAIGYPKGVIDIIDIQTGRLISANNELTNSVRQIIASGEGGHFVARDTKKAVMLDYQGKLLYKWAPKDPIIDMTIATNANNTGFVSLVHYKLILEFMFATQPDNQTKSYQKMYDGFYNGIKLAKVSPDHQYLHIVSDQFKRFTFFDITVEQEFQLRPQSADGASYEDAQPECPNKQKGSSQSEQKQAKNRTIIKFGNTLLEREFSFKIKSLLTDNKDQRRLDPQALIMVTDEGVIYYSKKGSLVTFVPYKERQNDELLSYDYCERNYFLTVHKSTSEEGDIQFYLTFFDKFTFAKEKRVQLGSLVKDIKQIVAMDCNGKSIVILTDKELIILENDYEEEAQFNEVFVTYAQWGLTGLLLILFICCRGRRSNQDDIQRLIQELQDEDEHEDKPSSTERQNSSCSSVGEQGSREDKKQQNQGEGGSRKEEKGEAKSRKKHKSA